jgi:signal transduction histidine kinase/CheY-like chemotaxis protein
MDFTYKFGNFIENCKAFSLNIFENAIIMNDNILNINNIDTFNAFDFPIGICIVNHDGAIKWANDFFKREFLGIETQNNINITSVFPSILSSPQDLFNKDFSELFQRIVSENREINYYSLEPITSTIKNDLITVIVHNKTEFYREKEITKLLLSLSKADHESKDLKQLFLSYQKELDSIMDARNMFIVLWDRLRLNLSLQFFDDEFDSYNEFPKGKTLSGYVIESGKSLLVNEDQIFSLQKEGIIDVIGTPAKCWMGVPLRNKGEIIGLIAVQSYKSSNEYSPSDLKILEYVSNKIAISIQRKENENSLNRAKELAEEADKLKSSFLANMSHEIRTPMNSIVGFAELITRPSIPQEKKDIYAEYISNSSKALLALIDDIIDISKIESKQVTITKTNIHVNQLLNELFEMFEANIAKSSNPNLLLRRHLAIADNNFSMLCDSVRLRQILINLISNGIKFTSEGFVEFGYIIPNNVTILFYVQDSGIGLTPEMTKVIFERFRQGDETITRKYGGTGLGLAISKKLVQLMGGQIWVESELGKGSTFFFRLPLIIPNNSEIILENIKKKTVKGSLADKSILIAEDEDTNFLFLQEVLSPTQAKIHRAINGKEAVEMTRNQNFSLVLMDIQMPIMNGYEATQKIKEFKPNIPIVAQTAYAMAEDRAKGFRAGCDGYLTKPIKPEDLLQMVKQFLGVNDD